MSDPRYPSPDDDAPEPDDGAREAYDEPSDAAALPDASDAAHDAEADADADEEPDADAEEAHRAVFVSTALPVQLTVGPLDDDRAPDGTALGAYIGERLVARCAMPREAIDRLMELDLFAEPVPLALLAVEEEPGLQCRLFALVPAERLTDGEDDDEPWKASVPSFEDAYGDADEEDEDDEDDESEDDDDDEDGDEEEGDEEDTTVASILLGHIVRFEKDRKFVGDLTAEAVDVLQKIVLGGQLEDANAKAVDDFLDSL